MGAVELHTSSVHALPSSAHGAAGVSWHVESQQSPFCVLPSSHCSPGSTLPLPHKPIVAVAVCVAVGGTGVTVAVCVLVDVCVDVAVCVAVAVRVAVTVGVAVA